MGQDSAVGIATRYGLESPGIENRYARFSAHVQAGPEVHQPAVKLVTALFPGGKAVMVYSVDHLLPSSN